MAKYWRAYLTGSRAHGSWIYFSTQQDMSLGDVVGDLLEDTFHFKTVHRYCTSISPITYAMAICAYPITTVETCENYRRSVVIR